MDNQQSLLPPDTPGTNTHWLSAIVTEMMRDSCAVDFIEMVRDELDMVAPLDERELDQNRAVPRKRVARAVQALAETYEWTGALSFLNYIYRPELIESESAVLMRSQSDELTPQREAWITAMSMGLHRAILHSGLHQVGVDIFSTLLTEYAISGELRTPPPLPSWFAGSVFAVPVLEDQLVVALCTRISHSKEIAKELQAECRRVFQTGQGGRGPKNPQRDLWIVDQYQKIRDELPDQREYDKQMAALLGHDEAELVEATVLDELLRRFTESEWKGELTRYDLTDPKGIRKAKNFLKQIVHRQRVSMKATLESMPYILDS
jgi:hypothetical protein